VATPARAVAPAPARTRESCAAPALSAIERTLDTLLSPLDFPDWKSWQVEVHSRLLELTGADSLCMYTPLAAGPQAWLSPHLSEDALCQYAVNAAANPKWDVIESAFAHYAGSTGEAVAHEDDLLPRAELESSAFYQEFLRPNRIFDLTVAGVSFGGSAPARLHFASTKRLSPAKAAERRTLIRTILPAFRSGLAQWKQIGDRRADLGRVLDVLADAVLLYDMSGVLVHANPAAVAVIAGKDGAHGTLRGTETNPLQIEAQRVAWNMGALSRRSNSGSLMGTPGLMPATTTLPSATRETKVDGQAYTLRGSLAPSWMLGRAPGVIVTIETTSAKASSDADLRERFSLTAREVEVARLVASGLSNQALAEKLGVSFFTARNHVERLMGKMGAMNRAHIGALVRGDAALV
jgi:DNA-binding CsgD family transcriptional regulator/PAS domain-containing protein